MKYLNGLFLILVIASSPVFGYGYHDSITNGTVLGGFSPYTVALGTVRAVGVREAASIFTNPAQTANYPFTIQLSGSSISWTERVIENDIDKTIRTQIINSNGMAAIVYPLGGITIGAGVTKVGEFGYDGMTSIFEHPSSYVLIGLEVLQAQGSQIEAMGSISTMISGDFSAGISGGIRRAQADYQYFYDSYQVLVPDSSLLWSQYSKEFAWHAGLALNGQIFKSGLSYASETEHMKDIIALGGSAFAEHIQNVTVGFEAEVTSPFNKNQFMGKLFLRMPLKDSMEAMVSVSFDDNRVANRAGLGFGMGFSGRLGNFSIGGGLLNRFRARRNTAFPNEESDRIDDSYTIFNFGVSYLIGD